MTVENVTLSNGIKMPLEGFGVFQVPDATVCKQAVLDAIKTGYRLIDTAQAYENEKGVGEGVRTCGVAREELFITTKVAAECKSYESAAASIDGSLAELGLDYIDLMIIHSPQPWMEVNQSDNRYYKENLEAWRALEDAYKAGKIKAIGVSNFLIDDLKNIIDNCEIKPMVNQILCHISNTPVELVDFCNENGIQLEAYSPVAHGAVLGNEAIKAVADKYGVSIPQLCLKYDIQLGMVVIPKTANPAHMESNAALDFTISDEDMEMLKNFEHIKDYGAHSFFPVFGGKL